MLFVLNFAGTFNILKEDGLLIIILPQGLTDVTPEGYSRMTHLLSNSAGGKVIVALEVRFLPS